MSLPSETRPKSVFRIITLILSTIFLGNLIAVVACYVQPRVYESTGVFTEWATPNQSTKLAGNHAATAVLNLELHNRWGIPFEDAVLRVQEIVNIETTASTTVIRVRARSAPDSRIIVSDLMKWFPGFERTRQWAQTGSPGERFTKNEEKTHRMVQDLKTAIWGTLKDTGNHVPGSLVTAETVARLENKDLDRQFKAYQKAAQPNGRFVPPDGNLSVPPEIAALPYESQSAVSPDIDTYFLVGRIAGLIAAIFVLFTILRLRPSLLEVPPPKPVSTPAWAETRNKDCEEPTW